MNLNDDKNILLAKKAVYAEQLLYDARLCEVSQELVESAQRYSPMSPEDIKKKYSGPLSKIISSDDIQKTLQELDEERIFDVDRTHIGKKYSQNELKYFQKFARVANTFKTFQKASELLNDVTDEKTDSKQRDEKLKKFHNYMSHANRPKSVQHFDKLIQTHSPRYIGSRFFLIANESINKLNNMDEFHSILDPVVIRSNMTPDKFGAVINGYKTIQYKIESLEEQQGYEHTSSFNIDNWDLSNVPNAKVVEAKDEFHSAEHSFSEKAFVAGSSIKGKVAPVYKAHKGTFRKAAIIAAAVTTLIAGANQANKEFQAHNLDINSSTKYEQTISDNTEAYIQQIMDELNLQSNSIDPQYEDVKNIEGNIDLVLDYIVKDQVTSAFEKYHKDYKVKDVETWFDKSLSGTANSPEDYRFIDVSYIDDKGNPGKESISDFRSDFLTQAPLNDLFDLEENIDLDSPVWSAFSNDGTKNFLSKAQNIDEVMQYLKDATKLAQHISAFKMEHGHSLFGKPYLKSTLPEEKDDDAR